jgi:hypothetical protein
LRKARKEGVVVGRKKGLGKRSIEERQSSQVLGRTER